MPEIRYFIVTQTREVKVQANTLPEAAQLADAYFEDTPKPDLWGAVISPVRNTDLAVREIVREGR